MNSENEQNRSPLNVFNVTLLAYFAKYVVYRDKFLNTHPDPEIQLCILFVLFLLSNLIVALFLQRWD